MSSRPYLLPFLAGVVLVALIATTGAAVVQRQRAVEAEDRVEALETEVAQLRAQVEQLESAGPLGGLLDGLLGGDAGDLGGLLDGLLGGGGDGFLDGLLGGTGGIPGAECLVPGGGLGDLGGLLDGLLGGDAGDLGGLLDGLLGGDAADLGGLLDGLLGQDSDLGGLLDDLLGDPGTDATGTGLLRRTAASDDADPAAIVEEIADQVEQLRELSFTEDVGVDFLTSDELRAELAEILDESLDPDALAAQQALLVALGALPADADLVQLNRDLLQDQVAGFYRPEDGRLVVLVPDDGTIRPADRIIVAHELGHALADQTIGLPDLDDDTVDADAALAQLSVVEGDATLLMNLWTLEHLSFQEQLAMAGDADLLAQQETIERFPPHLQRELLFAYTAGLDLACDAYLEAGWSGVDALYDDPPRASVGVLFPERADDVPADPPALGAPSGGQLRHDDTFGAAPLSWLFDAPGGEVSRALDDAVDRAAAWTGGRAQVWSTSAGEVVGLAFQGGGPGAAPLCDSVTAWYAAAFPDATRSTQEGATVFEGTQDAVVRCDGDAVRVAIAPELATATQVAAG